MNIAPIQRGALALGMRVARLPLTVAEATLQRGRDTSDWPPTLAFDRAEAALTGLVGNLLDDDALRASSQLRRAEVAQRADAAAKRAEAETKRLETSRRADEETARVEAERRRVAEAAAQRQQELEDERRRTEQRIEQAAAKKRAATRKQAPAQRASIEKAEAQAEAVRLREEADALRLKEQVVDGQDEVLELDRKVRAKKAARRAG